jgi:hypothetical protein
VFRRLGWYVCYGPRQFYEANKIPQKGKHVALSSNVETAAPSSPCSERRIAGSATRRRIRLGKPWSFEGLEPSPTGTSPKRQRFRDAKGYYLPSYKLPTPSSVKSTKFDARGLLEDVEEDEEQLDIRQQVDAPITPSSHSRVEDVHADVPKE